MNVEKLQKMNELAKELKSHGLAESMDDAYTQADSMINNGAYIEIRNVMDEKNPITQSIVEERRANNQVVELHEKLTVQNSKIDQMNSVIMKMQEVMNDMISEVVKLKEHKSVSGGVNQVLRPDTTSMNSISNESPAETMRAQVQTAQSEMINAAVPQVEIAVQRAQSTAVIEAPAMSQLRLPENNVQAQSTVQAPQRRGMYAEKQEESGHPRQGAYTPMDVSIEKFFNVNKR